MDCCVWRGIGCMDCRRFDMRLQPQLVLMQKTMMVVEGVARTLDPELSRMTIAVDVDAALRQQVIKQMNKLINVLQATDLTESPAVVRELVLVRIRTTQEARTAVLKEAEIFAGRVVDSSVEGFAIEVTGDPEKLNEFIDVMRSYGEIDVTRSGALAIGLESKKLRLQPPVPTRAGAKVEEKVV